MACIVHAKINVAASTCGLGIKQRIGKTASLLVFKDRFPKIININCFSSEDKRGFGPPPMKKKKPQKIKAPAENLGVTSQTSDTSRSDASIGMAPSLSNSPAGKPSSTISDHQFEEKLEAVKRSVKEQKKAEKDKLYQAIDYDAPTDSEPNKTGLGYKIGIGVAVVVFGIVFAVGDFLPFGSDSAKNKPSIAEKQLSKEEKTILQTRLQEYDMILSTSPDDPVALEGAAVTLAELGEYNRAASVLETFIKEKPKNPEAYRLLGEVKYELKDYEGSVVAYKNAKSVSESVSLEILRGLTNSLLATKRPDEAVQILLETRENIKSLKSNGDDFKADKSDGLEEQIVDPVQIELLLGKAYSYWGRISDAVSVYDQLISTHPNDFRGYLAKGIILKENGKVGDAERMFIQARFFAPEKTKVLVDRYSR